MILTFALGLLPSPLLRRMEPSVKRYLAQYHVKYRQSEWVARSVPRRAVLLDPAVLADAKLAPYPKKGRPLRDVLSVTRGREPAAPAAAAPGRSVRIPAVTAGGRDRPFRQRPRGGTVPRRPPGGGGPPPANAPGPGSAGNEVTP